MQRADRHHSVWISHRQRWPAQLRANHPSRLLDRHAAGRVVPILGAPSSRRMRYRPFRRRPARALVFTRAGRCLPKPFANSPLRLSNVHVSLIPPCAQALAHVIDCIPSDLPPVFLRLKTAWLVLDVITVTSAPFAYTNAPDRHIRPEYQPGRGCHIALIDTSPRCRRRYCLSTDLRINVRPIEISSPG